MPVNLFKVFDGDHNHLEVLSYIFSSLPFPTLVSLSGVSRSLRKVVQYHIRKRTEFFVKLFIPKDYVVDFFDKLKSTRASLAGSLVRCIVTNEMYGHFKKVNPSRLHIIVPYSSPNAEAEDQQMSKWVRLLATCGYKTFASYNEISEVVRASCQQVMYLKPTAGGERSITLVEAKRSSVFPPVFQSSQTSSFYVMSSTRIYFIYPRLHDHNINISLREPGYKGPLESFTYGLLTLRSTDAMQAFGGKCGEACPSVHRRVRGYPGWRVFRWGGIRGDIDTGDVVSTPDPYDDRDLMWKLPGECSRIDCDNFTVTVDIFEEAV